MSDRRVCFRCKAMKDAADFARVWCRVCTREYHANYRAMNRQKIREQNKAWKAEHAAEVRVYSRTHNAKWRASNPNYFSEWRASNPNYSSGKSLTNAQIKERYPATYKKSQQRKNRKNQANNEASRRTADRAGHEWTGWEYELIAQPNRKAGELALLLGRTEFAIRTQRSLLRSGDPKTLNRAGILIHPEGTCDL